MHHFVSNSSVTINAVTQETGVIKGEVYVAQIGTQSDGSVNIECTFTNNDTGTPVHHMSFRPTLADLETFEGTVTLDETSVAGRFQELATRYVVANLDGKWGLNDADWTVESH